MLDKLHILISIVATMVVTLISLVQEVDLHTLAVRLIVVIIAFYALGLAIKLFIIKYVFPVILPEPLAEDPPEDADAEDETSQDGTMFETLTGPTKPPRSKYD